MKSPAIQPDWYERVVRTLKAGGPSRLRARQDLHLARKIWHMSMGVVIVAIYLAGTPKPISLALLGFFFLLFLGMETARLRNPALNQLALKLWGPLMRSHETHRLSGIPYFLGSALAAVAIFPQPVAVLSLLYLAIGDPVASVFGILYGDRSARLKNGKSLIGTMAGVGICTLISLVYLSGLHLSYGTVILLSLIGGAAGGTAEILPIDIDDNFTIPIISGLVLWLAWIIFV
jgi:diacylglycerol kinase (CTP)